MNHIAIDLGGMESQFCMRREDGEMISEGRIKTHRIAAWLKSRPHSRVVLETCAEAFKVADQTLELGHEVRVVPATLAKTLGVGARSTKTDERDARALSEVSCRIDLPSVHLRSQLGREYTSMYRAREGLVSSRTKLINVVRGYLRTQLIKVRSGGVTTFADRVRKKCLEHAEGLPQYIERLLQVLEELCQQIKAADEEMETIANNSDVCGRLMTVPGVGSVTAVRYMAAIDEISRFPNSHSVGSYLGLTPGEHSSSGRKQRLGITKAGSPEVRKLLSQAAWSFWRTQPHAPMAKWADQVAHRRGRPIASVALARKLSGILYAIWRDGTTYQPSRAVEAANG